MDLKVIYDFLNFLANKQQFAFYAPEVLDSVMDRAQMSLYATYYPQYGTSEDVQDSLSPFKRKYPFSNISSPGGLITWPADLEDVLALETIVLDSSNIARPRPVPFLNEDECTDRKNSQVIPLSTWNPFAENADTGIQLWPAIPQAGTLTYLKRPTPPVFVYTLVSGRVVVYNQGASTQLEWFEKDINSIIIKAASSLGINCSETDLMQYAETKDNQNINTKDKY